MKTYSTERAKSIKRAMKAAKKRYSNRCIITGQLFPDGAHIFPRSTSPELVAVPENIIPLNREHHRKMDSLTSVENRLLYVASYAMPENRHTFIEQVQRLRDICREKNI